VKLWGIETALEDFLASEAAGGLMLMAVAALALVIANSPLAPAYFATLEAHVGGLSVLDWIDDALMAVFFLLVGLEIKREVTAGGQLRLWSQRVLPGLAAVGGLVVPALIYAGLNARSPDSLRGWAIPSATDIAFALGVLSLLGPRVPASLKVFLTALAIIDDLAAVVIIAVFHTTAFSLPMFAAGVAMLLVLAGLNWRGVRHLAPYLVIGAVLWFFVFRSGIHATLAGVALAFTVPIGPARAGPARDELALGGTAPVGLASHAAGRDEPPLIRLEHGLHRWVAFLIVPIFGLANAGVSFAGINTGTLVAPVTLGVALGLFFGKQIGVFAFAWVAIRMKWAEMPAQATWMQLYGVAALCGIGFTMSLFIGLLAFTESDILPAQVKIGVLAGSLASALTGALILRAARPGAGVVRTEVPPG
jgi:NhaA family Na+:H+ antiporter